jgi:Kef-type K+ transport system membrane component KefB
MTSVVIISLCVLILIAYIFDITASFTKLPSVILLLTVGWVVKKITHYYEINTPNLSDALPILGTIGLILIVLEGSLELELNKSKIPLIKKSIAAAFFPMVILAFAGAFALTMIEGYSFRVALVNFVPLCIISSSLAIPSVKQFSAYDKEFVTYESSLSDILGLIFFNYVITNKSVNVTSVGFFISQILIIIIISFIATALLSFLLSRIEHEIKFVPIIMLVILIYEASKVFQLPSLVFILVFGLFLGNIDELKHVKWLQKLKPQSLDKEVNKFLGFVMEVTFLTKAMFFILFGYLIETRDLVNTSSLVWSLSITATIFLLRALQLKISGLPIAPLVFIAPRGLINILLFLSIPATLNVTVINSSVLIQVIIMTALVMMFGTIARGKQVKKPIHFDENAPLL